MKKFLILISILFNCIILLLLFFSLSRKSISLYLPDLNSASQPYTSAACVVSVPRENATVVFGPVEFSLRVGSEASLQFSVIEGKKQVNLAVETLYDRSIIYAERSGYGLTIRGLKPGETVMQLFTVEGVRNVAVIKVTD